MLFGVVHVFWLSDGACCSSSHCDAVSCAVEQRSVYSDALLWVAGFLYHQRRNTPHLYSAAVASVEQEVDDGSLVVLCPAGQAEEVLCRLHCMGVSAHQLQLHHGPHGCLCFVVLGGRTLFASLEGSALWCTLDKLQLRHFVDGLYFANQGFLVSSVAGAIHEVHAHGEQFRDDALLLCMMAGYTAHFVAAGPGMWRVLFAAQSVLQLDCARGLIFCPCVACMALTLAPRYRCRALSGTHVVCYDAQWFHIRSSGVERCSSGSASSCFYTRSQSNVDRPSSVL
jgi:hypothetical protein